MKYITICGVRYFELERKPPYLDAWLGGYWLTRTMAFWFLLFAAFDGACGWRYCIRGNRRR